MAPSSSAPSARIATAVARSVRGASEFAASSTSATAAVAAQITADRRSAVSNQPPAISTMTRAAAPLAPARWIRRAPFHTASTPAPANSAATSATMTSQRADARARSKPGTTSKAMRNSSESGPVAQFSASTATTARAIAHGRLVRSPSNITAPTATSSDTTTPMKTMLSKPDANSAGSRSCTVPSTARARLLFGSDSAGDRSASRSRPPVIALSAVAYRTATSCGNAISAPSTAPMATCPSRRHRSSPIDEADRRGAREDRGLVDELRMAGEQDRCRRGRQRGRPLATVDPR